MQGFEGVFFTLIDRLMLTGVFLHLLIG